MGLLGFWAGRAAGWAWALHWERGRMEALERLKMLSAPNMLKARLLCAMQGENPLGSRRFDTEYYLKSGEVSLFSYI